jgi:hypothetical protein
VPSRSGRSGDDCDSIDWRGSSGRDSEDACRLLLRDKRRTSLPILEALLADRCRLRSGSEGGRRRLLEGERLVVEVL